MEEQRFTIRYLKRPCLRGFSKGWHVCDNEVAITIPFSDEEEARKHRDNIEKIYARYGW